MEILLAKESNVTVNALLLMVISGVLAAIGLSAAAAGDGGRGERLPVLLVAGAGDAHRPGAGRQHCRPLSAERGIGSGAAGGGRTSGWRAGRTDTAGDRLNGQQLDSDNRLQIKNIEIDRRNAERARSLEAGLPVPLEMAIDMLSDREGVIAVTVPIDGRLSELRVGIQGIVVTAL